MKMAQVLILQVPRNSRMQLLSKMTPSNRQVPLKNHSQEMCGCTSWGHGTHFLYPCPCLSPCADNKFIRDTVSSIRGKSLPAATSGMRHAEYFRHALALDERRVKFLPEYMFKGSSMQDDRTELDLQYRLRHTKEVWFAGTHSDM